MKSQLTTLRKIVHQHLPVYPNLLAANERGNTKQAPINWFNELPKIKEELMVKINGLLLSNKNDHLVKRHLQQTQMECIALLNLLYSVGHSPTIQKEMHQALAKCIEELLLYLFTNHPYYFNLETNAPLLHVKATQLAVSQEVNRLKAGLKLKKVASELLDLIIDAFIRFTQLPFCSYQCLNYMKMLQASLIKLCSKIANPAFDEILIEHLIYYGFNENGFVGYCKNQVTIAITKLYHAEEQYEKLCCYEKFLLAQQEKACCSFSPQRLSTKLQMMAFVTAELNYLQKKQHYVMQKAKVSLTTDELPPNYRVKVSLSANSLAYFIRLLIETNVIQNEPRSKLLEFLARHFQTGGIGNKHLSAQSLGTKYKQVTQNTAMGLRHLLFQMIRKLEADFGKT